MGQLSCPSNGEEAEREQKKKAKDAKRIRGIVHESDKSKGTSHAQEEMEKLMLHDEQELLSLWEGWQWNDNNGGWLDPELCAKARREEVDHIRRYKICTRVSREVCLCETGKAPIKTGWAETDKGQPGKPNVRARWIANACEARVVRADAATGGAESSAVGDRHGYAWRKGCGIG